MFMKTSVVHDGEAKSRDTGHFAVRYSGLWRKNLQYRLIFTIAASLKTAVDICHSAAIADI